MGIMVDRGFVIRPAKTPREKLFVKREGKSGRWHARTEAGELICKDANRHDLQDWITCEGFSFVMIDAD